MRPAPAPLPFPVGPSIACVAVPCRVGRVEVGLVLLVASCGVVAAVWVLETGCVDAAIGKA
jgi:hypothetical protein